MKSLCRSTAWVWIAAIVLLVLLSSLAYIYLPGRGNLSALPTPDYWPTNGWQATTPEQQGIHSSRLAQEIQDIQDHDLAVDSLTIIRNGYVILDAYFAPYDGSFSHDLGSVAKSVTTALIGIAVGQGKLQLDQTVVSFFTDRSIANLDERKKSLTIGDLVSMRNGMESGCLEGDEATLDSMRASSDWVQTVLDRKMVHDPGTHFCYDSPGIHLLSAILQKVTGMTALEYAQIYLFGPLGIQDVVWLADPQDFTQGWGDLHLKPRDAAKLGYLWLHSGVWDGQQIVPAPWVSDTVTAHSRLVSSEYGYGYGWWVSPVDFYALGRGGQFIRVIPSQNMVVVITGGGFDIDRINSFLLSLLLLPQDILQANQAGQTDLDATLATLAQDNRSHSSIPMPEIAEKISGQTYICNDNPAAVSNVRLDFIDPNIAELSLVQYNQAVVWPIGMDGKYRVAADGQAQVGYWESTDTFVLEIFDIGQLTRTLSFAGNHLQVIIPEIDTSLECEIQKT